MNLSGIQRYFAVFLGIGVACCAAGLLPVLPLKDQTRGGLVGMGLGFMAPVLIARVLPKWWRESMSEEFDSRASSRYRRQIIPVMLAYVVLLVISLTLLRGGGIASPPLRALLSILPVLPLLLMFRAFMRYIGEVDEFKRRIELEAIAIGAMLLCCLYLPAAFLQMAKVIAIPADVALFYVFPLLAIGYAAGKFITLRRYR